MFDQEGNLNDKAKLIQDKTEEFFKELTHGMSEEQTIETIRVCMYTLSLLNPGREKLKQKLEQLKQRKENQQL